MTSARLAGEFKRQSIRAAVEPARVRRSSVPALRWPTGSPHERSPRVCSAAVPPNRHHVSMRAGSTPEPLKRG
jgi:hypothetical protein